MAEPKMIERMARAAYEVSPDEQFHRNFTATWEELSSDSRALRIKRMRAALEAVRDPTWQAIIDGALSEDQKEDVSSNEKSPPSRS